MNSSAASQAYLLDILFFGDAKLEHLRFPILNDFHGCLNDCWLNTTAANRACQLAALTDCQFSAWPARSRTGHRDDGGKSHLLTARTPTLNIIQYISHNISPNCIKPPAILEDDA